MLKPIFICQAEQVLNIFEYLNAKFQPVGSHMRIFIVWAMPYFETSTFPPKVASVEITRAVCFEYIYFQTGKFKIFNSLFRLVYIVFSSIFFLKKVRQIPHLESAY